MLYLLWAQQSAHIEFPDTERIVAVTATADALFITPCNSDESNSAVKSTCPQRLGDTIKAHKKLLWHVTTFYLIIWHNCPSVLWCCWLGGRKGIRPVKNMEWWGAGVVICPGQGANNWHMVQLMPLPPHHLLLQQNSEWFIILLPAYAGRPGKKAVKRLCVCDMAQWHYNFADYCQY